MLIDAQRNVAFALRLSFYEWPSVILAPQTHNVYHLSPGHSTVLYSTERYSDHTISQSETRLPSSYLFYLSCDPYLPHSGPVSVCDYPSDDGLLPSCSSH